jgi:hypothetical protein
VGGVGNWSLPKDLLKASPHLTDLAVHSPGAFPSSDRPLESGLVPRLQQISLEKFDLMVQLMEGRPVRSISIYSPFQLKTGSRAVLFDERVETLNLTLDEAHPPRVAEVIAHSTGVRSLGLSITLSPYLVCCPCRVTSLTLTEPHEGAPWDEYQDTPENLANFDHSSPVGCSFHLQARINRRDRPSQNIQLISRTIARGVPYFVGRESILQYLNICYRLLTVILWVYKRVVRCRH